MKLLIFPLKIEFQAFVDAVEKSGHSCEKILIEKIPVYTFKSLGFRCAVGGHGKVQFAAQTQFLINQLGDVKSVYCLGSSGALTSEVKPLDVVVATRTVEHDFNLKFIKRDKPHFDSNTDLLEDFKSLGGDGFNIHFGPIASGDEDVLDAARSSEIREETGALVTAWEGAGGARVCKLLSLPFIEVRAVSDSADSEASKDFRSFLSKTMANLASVVLKMPSVLSIQ